MVLEAGIFSDCASLLRHGMLESFTWQTEKVHQRELTLQ
jgi:hypothetical protein